MKNEKPKPGAKEPIDEQVTDTSAPSKKKKKTKQVVEAPAEAPKANKAKPEKKEKKTVEPKEQKPLKDDKLTKFLVSMKKSVRKSIKKEAAEVGVSMNEYIVLAVEEKLSQDSLKQ